MSALPVTDNPFKLCYAAFYADCQHEVQPVTSGHRLALIYNLCHTGPGPAPAAADTTAALAQLQAALSRWFHDQQGPAYLLYVLDHRCFRQFLLPSRDSAWHPTGSRPVMLSVLHCQGCCYRPRC